MGSTFGASPSLNPHLSMATHNSLPSANKSSLTSSPSGFDDSFDEPYPESHYTDSYNSESNYSYLFYLFFCFLHYCFTKHCELIAIVTMMD